jgi:hypothetical protein
VRGTQNPRKTTAPKCSVAQGAETIWLIVLSAGGVLHEDAAK